jgi:prephenate dehydrogenase
VTSRRPDSGTVGIIGLGLMGGSLGLALPDARRLGFDENSATADQAIARGAVDEVASIEQIAQECDIVVVATPVDATTGVVRELGEHSARGVIVDIASVKSPVVQAMDELPESCVALAGHPMCGRENPGIENAAADLYNNAVWALCRTSRTDDAAAAQIEQLLGAIGSEWIYIDATEHDRVVARTSHLPWLVGAALTRAVDDASLETRLFGGGLLDATRLAAGSERMWTAILRANGDQVLAALDAFESELAAAREAIAADGLSEWVGPAAARARSIRAPR